MLRCAFFAVFWGCIIAGLGPALADDDPDFNKIETLAKAAPEDVAKFVTRKLECFHWAGEEPYDTHRGREIERAMNRLRCDHLDRDEVALRKRHQNPSALGALDAAKTLPF
jgi:hypothetical protein